MRSLRGPALATVVAVAASLWTSPYAVPPLIAQRVVRAPVEELFLTSLPFTQERGEIQLGAAVQTRRVAGKQISDLPVSLEFGLMDNLELEFESGGMRYATRLSTPFTTEAGLGITAVRHAVLPGVHLGLTVRVDWERTADVGAAPTERVEYSAGALIDWEPLRALPLHVFANVPLGRGCSTSSPEEGEGAAVAGSAASAVVEPTCAIGALLSRGRAHLTLEVPLYSRRTAGAVVAAPGAIFDVGAFQMGAALLVVGEHPMRAIGGVRLLFIREF